MGLSDIIDSKIMHYACRTFNASLGNSMRANVNAYLPYENFLKGTSFLTSKDALHIARGDFQSRYDAVANSDLASKLAPDVRILSTVYHDRTFRGESVLYPFETELAGRQTIQIEFSPGAGTVSEIQQLLEHEKRVNTRRLFYLTSVITQDGRALPEQPMIYKAQLAKDRYTNGIELHIVGIPLERSELTTLGTAGEVQKTSGERLIAEYNRATFNYCIEKLEDIGLPARALWSRLNARRKSQDKF